MTTETLKEPAGWKGNTFYIGVKAYPIKVIVIREKPYEALLKTVEVLPDAGPTPETIEISVHKPQASEILPVAIVDKGGRPKMDLTPKQLSYLNKDLSIRQKASAMGISKSKVALLMKGSKAFTLIELLVVVAILGVLAAVVIPIAARYINGQSMFDPPPVTVTANTTITATITARPQTTITVTPTETVTIWPQNK